LAGAAGAAGRQNNPLAGFQASGDYALLDYAPVRDSVNAVVAASPVNTSVTKFVDCKGFPIYAIVVYLFALID
jgi:hypothetical protein